jgi:hypothetical protein
MDIVTHIQPHTENLQNVCGRLSTEQLKNLKLAVMEFYYLLPGFEDVVSRYIKIPITKDQLSTDISNGNLESYQTAIEKSNAEIDEYAADYEEPEALDIFILEALDNAVASTNNPASVAGLFLGVINTLDYYENFSDEPEYWNKLLEQELLLQNEIVSAAEKNELSAHSVYQKQYKYVDFAVL